jgi:protein involved in polysaccharide export with SLBB domain
MGGWVRTILVWGGLCAGGWGVTSGEGVAEAAAVPDGLPGKPSPEALAKALAAEAGGPVRGEEAAAAPAPGRSGEEGTGGLPPAPVPARARGSRSWRERYELGHGDVLNFALQGFPKLTRTQVPVAPDGTISYLQAKQVPVTGKTIDELRVEMARRLTPFHRDPRVIITPAVLGSKRYVVLGEVRQNGAYPLDQPIRLLEALARAGGINEGVNGQGAMELADYRRSFVVRGGRRLDVDLEALCRRGALSENILLEPDDYIYIASFVRNEVYIFGQVEQPGVRGIEPGMTAMGAVASAGGFTRQAWRDRVLVVRGPMDRPETLVVELDRVLHGKERDLLLEPGDIVFVSTRPWVYVTQVLDSAIVAYINGFAAGAAADGGTLSPSFRVF